MNLFFMFALTGTTQAFRNEPEGFRGLKWGDTPTEDMSFLYESEADSIKGYLRTTEGLRFEGIPMHQETLWQFQLPDEELVAVVLFFLGEDKYDRLKAVCRAKFGEETNVAAYVYEELVVSALTWIGQKTVVHLGTSQVTTSDEHVTLRLLEGVALVLCEATYFTEYFLPGLEKMKIADQESEWF